ncbi:Protein YidD [Paramagnetospirillum magnetotacticum MS-1]|uniref:Putative membrane protein insertion efficiency factor n=1 Tax=Paramagnetospirillum magnetotacticum MS-1 TaxID=272627 RepID=A0A0C2U971_PARME|nr:membrane protein insertion efficiency factor YidD [Paramagnetospirillum magnetotacticum]KIL98042.1 Protein YidD [Paramagnetospirillum magnetotacticum MS-1]
MNPIGLVMRGLIRLYQLLLSPVLPASCRFTPSCSAYAMQAIRDHGPVGGSWLGLKRICRCHPWNDGGYDPVPPAHTERGGTLCPSRLPE